MCVKKSAVCTPSAGHGPPRLPADDSKLAVPAAPEPPGRAGALQLAQQPSLGPSPGRVPPADPAGALVSASPAGTAIGAGGARGQDAAAAPPQHALRAAHRRCEPAADVLRDSESVIRAVELPGRNWPLCVSAIATDPRAARGASLILDAPHHRNTRAAGKVERGSADIAP